MTADSQPSTQALRDMIANLDIESAQLAKSNTAVGQAGATWLSRVARELKALLPTLESALPDYARIIREDDETLKRMQAKAQEKPCYILGKATIQQVADEGQLQTERVAFVAADELFHADPYKRIAALESALGERQAVCNLSQAVAQARVDEARQWDERICTQNYEWRQKRIADLERDLAVITKEGK